MLRGVRETAAVGTIQRELKACMQIYCVCGGAGVRRTNDVNVAVRDMFVRQDDKIGLTHTVPGLGPAVI